MRKVYYVTVTPDGNSCLFRRNAYTLLKPVSALMTQLTLVQYLGDETVAAAFPHGNATISEKPHTRTCPSVLKTMASLSEIPSSVYKKAIASKECGAGHQPVLLPRNVKQICNLQSEKNQKFRFTHDALYNVHELAYDLDGFVAKITTYPDLVLICGSQSIVSEMDRVLQCRSSAPQLLSYDTTFQLGDFYLSPLLFRHIAFTSSPVIPALFLIHEKKSQNAHEELMKHVRKVISGLKGHEKSIPIVTDEEMAICNAIDIHLPFLHRLKCWNHTVNAVKVSINVHFVWLHLYLGKYVCTLVCEY